MKFQRGGRCIRAYRDSRGNDFDPPRSQEPADKMINLFYSTKKQTTNPTNTPIYVHYTLAFLLGLCLSSVAVWNNNTCRFSKHSGTSTSSSRWSEQCWHWYKSFGKLRLGPVPASSLPLFSAFKSWVRRDTCSAIDFAVASDKVDPSFFDRSRLQWTLRYLDLPPTAATHHFCLTKCTKE